jgi:hypothetical protein
MIELDYQQMKAIFQEKFPGETIEITAPYGETEKLWIQIKPEAPTVIGHILK